MSDIYQDTIKQVKRLVIKIGSGILTRDHSLKTSFFTELAKQVASLQKKGIEVVLVSSGAIACGMGFLKLSKKPAELAQKQAVAAIGQPRLMNLYSQVFNRHQLSMAQILLTRSDLEDAGRSLNAWHAIRELFRLKVIPVINENDSVGIEEIKFGDNDQLSAFVARLIQAQLLVILTDTDGLHDLDPKKHKKAKRIPLVKKIDSHILKLARGTTSHKSTGGMITKLRAAYLATGAGVATWIVNGVNPKVLTHIFNGEDRGTLFLPRKI